MKNLLKAVLCIYLCLSVMWSVVYCNSDCAWSVANERNGLLVWGYDDTGWWILSPFTNYADVFLLGATLDEDEGLRLFSDGLDSFGEYDAN